MSLEEQVSTRMMGKGTESKLLLKVCDSLSPSPNPIPCEPTTQGKSVTYVSGTKCYLCLGPLKGSERTSFLSMTRVCVLFADFDGGASLVPATARSALGIAGSLLKSLSWRLAKLQTHTVITSADVCGNGT